MVNSLIFYLYVIFLISITLFPVNPHFPIGWRPSLWHLSPSDSLRNILGNHSMYSIIANLAGNIFVFFPLGFFLPLIYCRLRKYYKTAVVSFLISLGIELVQLSGIPYLREFDTLDIILNTIGSVGGYAVYRALSSNKPLKLN